MDTKHRKHRILCTLCILVTALSPTSGQSLYTDFDQVFPDVDFINPEASKTYQCPTGWEQRPSSPMCYKFYDVELPHEAASMACSNQGGMLAEVLDMGDNLYIGSLVDDTASYYWTGYQPNYALFAKWGAKQPATEHDCAKAKNSDHYLYPWFKHSCHDALPFVCQMHACLSDEFKCRNGHCIKLAHRLNGDNDCGDHSDEWNPNSNCDMAYFSLTSGTRTLSSNPYPNSGDCMYLLEGPVGYKLEIRFTTLQTEKYHDVLSVYTGSHELRYGRYAAHFSGVFSQMPPKIVSENNFILLLFDSDDSNAGINQRRFTATWGVETTSTMLPQMVEAPPKASPGTLVSPVTLNTDARYPINTHASWIITAPNEFDVVTVLINQLMLNDGDEIRVYMGTEVSADAHFITFNGPLYISGTTDYFTSSTSSVRIVMKTSSLESNMGFSFTYYIGCDVDLTAMYGKIHTPGAFSSTVEGDITVENKEYPILRTCVYTVASGANFTLLSTQNVGLGTGDSLQMVFDSDNDGVDETEMVANAAGVDLNVVDGDLVITFTSDITASTGVDTGMMLAYSIDCDAPDPAYSSDQISAGTYGTTFGSMFSVSCPLGEFFAEVEFESAGAAVAIECEFGGDWNHQRLPTCSPEYCGAIPNVDNAAVAEETPGSGMTSFEGAQVGDTVTYECNQGANAGGSLTIACQDNGMWETQPTCSLGICAGSTADPSFGTLETMAGTLPNVGTVLEVQCNDGYEQTAGLPIIVCQLNLAWNDNPGNVVCSPRKCVVPSVIHATDSTSNVIDYIEFDTSVTYTCDSGYIVQGEDPVATQKTIACVLNAENTAVMLENSPPVCVNRDECTDGTGNCASSFGTTCMDTDGSFDCVCADGFELNGAGTTCTNINECLTDNGGCEGGCMDATPTADTPTKYTCTCSNGFEVYTALNQNGFGAGVLYGDDTNVDPDQQRVIDHSCIRSVCPHPSDNAQETFANGHLLVPSNKQYFYTQETVTVMCNLGYVIQGGSAHQRTMDMMCQDAGTWSVAPPVCEAVQCASVTTQGLLIGLSVPPTSYSIDYSATDLVDFYDQTSSTVGVVTAICEPPESIPSTEEERKLYCVFDFTDDTYKLLGDSLECSDTRVDCGTPDKPGLTSNPGSTLRSATFTFACTTGNPMGSSSLGVTDNSVAATTVTCLDSGVWDYGTLACSAVTCQDPGTPHDGTQVASSYEEGLTVTFTCTKTGFEAVPAAVYCDGTGNWRVDDASGAAYNLERPDCVDTVVPVFAYCPDNWVYWVNRYDYITDARILAPAVTDNHFVMSVTHTPNNFDLEAPVTADTTLVFTAQDFETAQANTATCSVNIRVKREELPVFTSCPPPVMLTLDEELDSVVVDVNSGDINLVSAQAVNTFDMVTGLEPAVSTFTRADLYQVRIIEQYAQFAFGNTVGQRAVCPVAVMLEPNQCTEWAFRRLVPAQGTVTFDAAGTTATVTCNAGYGFRRTAAADTSELTSLVYTCGTGATEFTTTGFEAYVPQCVSATKADYEVEFEVNYDATVTITGTLQPAYDNHIDALLNTAATQIKNDASGRCSASNLDVAVTVVGDTTVSGASADTLEVTYKVTLSDSSSAISANQQLCASTIETFYITQFGNTPWALNSIQPTGRPVAVGTNQNPDAQGQFSCPTYEKVQDVRSGSSLVTSCLKCPPGHMNSDTDPTGCEMCAQHKYQASSGQATCTDCNAGTGTFDMGATSSAQCYAMCPAPTVSDSPDSMFPCSPCAANTYWADPDTCTSCDNGFVTRGPRGVATEAGCLDDCVAGQASYDGKGGSECRDCPIGYYSPSDGASVCTACGNAQTTAAVGTSNLADCQDIAAACTGVNCGANGACAIESGQVFCQCNAGYTGDSCQTNINECESDPCFYGGTCVDLVNGYRCDNCPLAFTMQAGPVSMSLSGSAPDVPLSGQTLAQCQTACLDRSACQMIVYNSATSGCFIYNRPLTDFTQDAAADANIYEKVATETVGDCEGEPDDCASDAFTNDPCLNGGMCQDLVLSYTCLCPSASNFGGNRCGTVEPVCQSANCNNGQCREVPTGDGGVSSIYFYCECNAGWTGEFCDTDIDECAPNPCWFDNECTESTTPGSYSCSCPTSTNNQALFSGLNCQTRTGVNLCSGVGCSGDCAVDYAANEPMCLCEPGTTKDTYMTRWFNADVSTSGATPSEEQAIGDYETVAEHRRLYGIEVCNGVDTVMSAECRISGSTGTPFTDANNPVTFVDPHVCNENGLWCNDTDVTGGTCDDYEVRYICKAALGTCQNINECLEPVTVIGQDSSPVLECAATADSCTDSGYGIQCSCAAGYEGFFCDQAIDDCVDGNGNPLCQNGAGCTDGDQTYTCSCLGGFSGDNCEININDCTGTPCLNGGSCIDGVQSHTCNCVDGWSGADCSEDINDCITGPCRHGAACVDQPPGNAAPYMCTCRDPWEGTLCADITQECAPASCQNNGECFSLVDEFYCSCSPGSIGETCDPGQHICTWANPCANGGTCSVENGNPVCACLSSFDGEWCEKTRDFCSEENNVCENGGTCTITNTGAGYSCACADGFSGSTCSVNTNDCLQLSCGAGTCLDAVEEAYCVCPFNRIGVGCTKSLYRDYDMCLSDPVHLVHPFELESADLSISVWVKYNTGPGITAEGVFFELRTAESATESGDGLVVVRMSHQGININLQGTVDTPQTPGTFPDILSFSNLAFAINDGYWHHVVMTYHMANQKLIAKVDDTRTAATDLNAVSNSGNENFSEFADVQLGSDDFHGCVSLAQVWGSVLSNADITGIFGAKGDDSSVDSQTSSLSAGLKLDWGWGAFEIGPNAHRMLDSTRGDPTCGAGEELNENTLQCDVTDDRTPPEIVGCPSDEQVPLNPNNPTNPFTAEVTFDSSTFFSDADGIDSMVGNYETGVRLSVGKYQIVHNAYDAAGNRATCAYNVYVQFGDCSDYIPNPATGNNLMSSVNGLYAIYNFQCAAGDLPITNPEQLVCGPSGILNQNNAYVSERIPECSATNTNYKVNLDVSWEYNILSGIALSGSQPVTVMNHVRTELQAITGLCTNINNCEEPDVVIELNQNANPVTVTITVDGADPIVNGMPVKERLYEAIIQGDGFYIAGIGSGVEVKVETYSVTQMFVCDTLNHMAWIPDQHETPICAPCGRGTFYNSTTHMCEYCPIGQYQAATAQATCVECTTGTTTETHGSVASSECFESCDIGHFYNENGSPAGCEECPIGEFQSLEGKNYCIRCPSGQTTQVTGATDPSQCQPLCNAGYELEGEDCVACPLGEYREAGSIAGCQECDVDHTTPAIASTSAADCNQRLCDAGEFSVEGEDRCEQCPQNEYKEARDNATECVACADSERTDQPGSTMATDCRFFCGAGEFIMQDANDVDAPPTCEPCPKDTYKDLSANDNHYAVECTVCDAGGNTGTLGTGSIDISACVYDICMAGQQILAGATTCTPCPFDEYQSVGNPIPGDDTDNANLCMPCDENFGTDQMGSNAAEDCMQFCPSGQELVDGECQDCAVGYFKDNTVSEAARFEMCTRCTDTDFVTPGTGSTADSQCTIRDCPAGTFIDTMNSQCTNCTVEGYSSEPYAEQCTPCPSGSQTSFEGATSVDDCDQYPGTQPFRVTNLRYNVAFQNVADESAIETSIDAFLSAVSGFTAYRAVNVLALTWTTDPGPSETLVVVQVLVDNTGYPAEGTQARTTRIEEDRDEVFNQMTAYINAQTSHNSLPTVASTPVVIAQPSPFCADGNYRDADGACQPCIVGEFQPSGTVEVCIPCYNEYSTSNTGSTSEDSCLFECGAGEERNAANDACEMCDEDSVKAAELPAVATCTQCAAQQHGNSDRTVCFADSTAGQFSTAAEAVDCAVGTYSTMPNVEACDDCPTGTSTVDVGATSEDLCIFTCPAGEEADPQNDGCVACGVTSFKNATVSEAAMCMLCPDNFHASDDRQQCLADSVAGEFSTAAGAMPCPNDTYSTQADVLECTACPGSTKTLSTGSTSEAACLSQCELTNPCLNGGSCSPTIDDTISCMCAPMFQGDLCDIAIDSNESGGTTVPVINFVFRIAFDADFFAITSSTASETNFRNAVINVLTIFLTRPGSQVQNEFLRIIIIGLTSGSSVAEIRFEGNATDITSTARVGEVQQALDDEADSFIVAQSNEPIETNLRTVVNQEPGVMLEQTLDGGQGVCSDGNKLNLATGMCVPCDIGEYQPSTDVNTCRPCPGTSTTSVTGSTSLTACMDVCATDPDYCNGNGDCDVNANRESICNCDDDYKGSRCSIRRDPEDSEERDERNLIIGLSVGGGLLLLIIICLIGCFCLRMNTSRASATKSELPTEYPQATPSVMGYYPAASYPTAYSTGTYAPQVQPYGSTPLAILPAQGVENYMFYDEQAGNGGTYGSGSFR